MADAPAERVRVGDGGDGDAEQVEPGDEKVDVGDRQLLGASELKLELLAPAELLTALHPNSESCPLAEIKLERPLVSVRFDVLLKPFAREVSLQLALVRADRAVQDLLVVAVVDLDYRSSADFDAYKRRQTLVISDARRKVHPFCTALECLQYVDATVKVYGKVATCLCKGLYALRAQGSLCDVVLVVDGAELLAHKVALAVDSPVFWAMFTQDFKEGRESRVEVEGVSRELFDKFLKFLYTREVEEDDDQNGLIGLLGLADRYMVDSLKTECERLLMTVKKERVVSLLREAVDKPFISSEVRRRAAKVVIENWDFVKGSAEWREFETKDPVLADLLIGASRK